MANPIKATSGKYFGQTCKPTRCIGIIGRLIGHKYYEDDRGTLVDHCLRCGMPKGGWK